MFTFILDKDKICMLLLLGTCEGPTWAAGGVCIEYINDTALSV